MINVFFCQFREEADQKTDKRQLSSSEEEIDSEEDNTENPALNGHQEELSQSFNSESRNGLEEEGVSNEAEDNNDTNSRVI